MKKIPVYNSEGKIVEEIDLNPKIFGVAVKPELVQQAVVIQMANARKVLAHTKDRSEVRGGGAKPWRQKGTGRARHGSIRSPIWVGGGITFGPTKDRNFHKRINKKAKRKALFMVLSDRTQESKVIVLNELVMKEIKTKALAGMLAKLPVKSKKTTIILPKNDGKIVKSARNISGIKTIQADSLNIKDVLESKYLLIIKESLRRIEEVYLKSKSSK